MPDHHLISKIIDIGDKLHRSGCPPFKLEKYVEHYARNRGIEAMVAASPTSVNYQFFDGESNAVIIKRLPPPDIDLTLLALTINRITRDDESIAIESKATTKFMSLLAYTLTPAAYLMLVGNTFDALIFSPLFGLLVWLCSELFKGRRAIIVEFLAPLLSGILAQCLNAYGWNIPVWPMCIACILLFVPGLSISNALECLAFNDLVSGSSLLGQCILSLIKLFTGILIGLSIGHEIWNTPPIAYANELPGYFTILGAATLAIAVGIAFNIRPKDIVRGLPAVAMATWGPTLLSFDYGWVVATWLTTTMITLYANWVANRYQLANSIYMIQGIILLVPGSRVLASVGQNFYEAALLPISGIGSSAALIFATIVVGQITAFAIYTPKIDR